MLKASEVLAATKAVCADFEFTGVTTDSRAVKPGELFHLELPAHLNQV